MSLKKNTFVPFWNAFHESLADLNAYQHFIRWQLGHGRKLLIRSLEIVKKEGKPDSYFIGSGLSLMNIFHDGEFRIAAPLGKRITKGADLLRMSGEMEGRFNSFILVSVFETLERFFKAMYAEMLFQLRGQLAPPKQSSFHHAQPRMSRRKGTPQYFFAYVEHACRRGTEEAQAVFQKHLDWKTVVHDGRWDMTWVEIVGVLAFCRHRIVHNYGRMSPNDLRELSRPQQTFVRACLGRSIHDREECLLVPTEKIDECFEVLASHGWGLHVLVSKHCAMDDETHFWKPKDGGRRKVKPR
jgi:hypothetical protein